MKIPVQGASILQNRILQIGSGSMGTRRMRDLSAIGDVTVALFDPRADRRQQARDKFGIQTFDNLSSALDWGPESLTISTPPDHHEPYIEIALETGLNFFCEADIWTYDYQKIEAIAAAKSLIAAPSCTLYFLPIIGEVKRIVDEELGVLSNYSMCLSVDAPNWHPSEGLEYYARHRSTSPSREMVPFELIGLNYMFGIPVDVTGSVKRRGTLDMDSEDTWCLQMYTEDGAIGQLSVLMASPQTMRSGWAGGSNGFVQFDLISGDVVRRLPAIGIDDRRDFGKLPDILETVYAAEMQAFVRAIRHQAEWPFNYFESSIATGTLAAAERSSISRCVERVDPAQMPAILPDQYDSIGFNSGCRG